MGSFLIIGRENESIKNYAAVFLEREKVDKLDIGLIESEKAVGIASVREFQKKIYLKPFKSKQKAIILNAKNGITQEAQNALLKVLEEPPQNTIIIILAENKNSILPTIISRCKIIHLKEAKKTLRQREFEEILLSLNQMETGDKLKLAQDNSKDKETALLFIENLLIAGKNLLETGENKNILSSLKLLQKTYTEIKTSNINIRLSLENLFLNL